MGQDHVSIKRSVYAINTALDNGAELLSNKEWLNIGKAFNIFYESLKYHIQLEDTILYDNAQTHTKENSVFYTLIADHLQIMELLNDCDSALKVYERRNFSVFFSRLADLLEEHTIREEALMNVDSSSLEASAREIIVLLKNVHVCENGRTR